MFAAKHVPTEHLVEFVQYAELYGTENNFLRACSDLAEKIEGAAEHCPSFRELSFRQMLGILQRRNLVGTEDDVLGVLLKWVELNPQAREQELGTLYGCIRLGTIIER